VRRRQSVEYQQRGNSERSRCFNEFSEFREKEKKKFLFSFLLPPTGGCFPGLTRVNSAALALFHPQSITFLN